MSTLTKEWLQQTIAELEEERDAVPGAVNEDAANALAAMKLALASLEAEPVAYIRSAHNPDGFCFADGIHPTHRHQRLPLSTLQDGCYWKVTPLYTAPPAPVSVPPAIHDEDFEKALSVLNDTLDDCGDSERGLLLALDKAGIEVRSDACRAAMLQGADGNSLVIPDGLRLALSNAGIAAPESDEMLGATLEKYIQALVTWVKDRKPFQPAAPDFREIVNSSTNNCRENAETSTKCWCRTCRPITLTDMRFVVCPDCGNKRCPHANDHRNACTGSNEPGQEGSAYPAAPQQEVK